MIKGCRRKMVIVSGLNDSSFETAYFVLKDIPEADVDIEEDILEKANSIIENYSTDTLSFKKASSVRKDNKKNKEAQKSSFRCSLISFMLGFFTGGLILAGIFVMFL